MNSFFVERGREGEREREREREMYLVFEADAENSLPYGMEGLKKQVETEDLELVAVGVVRAAAVGSPKLSSDLKEKKTKEEVYFYF